MTGDDDSEETPVSLTGVDTYGFPTGMHPVVEQDSLHREFFGTNQLTSTAVMDICQLKRMATTGTTTKDLLGYDATLISTTTVGDEILYDLSIEEELEIVCTVQPNLHIGFDCPVYKQGDMPADRRRQNIQNYIDGINWLHDRLADTEISILPLLKATCPEEYAWCYEEIEHICNGSVAYYSGQYFGPAVGCRNKQLRQDLWEIDATCQPTGIFLLGLLSPRYLRPLPGSVVAASGLQQWISRTDFRNVRLELAQARYQELEREIEASLDTNTSQATLTQFPQAVGKIHG